MIHQKVAPPYAASAFTKLRGGLARLAILGGAMSAVACSGRTDLEGALMTPSPDSDTSSPEGVGSFVEGHEGGLYGPCIGNNDATRGSCAEGQVCGSMPDVGYSYCMPSLPCAAGMASVIDLACAHPCDAATDCFEHGLSKCAANPFAEFTGPPGWCTP